MADSIRITGTKGDFYYTVKQYSPSRELEKGCFGNLRDVAEILADFPDIRLISSGARLLQSEDYAELKGIGREAGIEVVFTNG